MGGGGAKAGGAPPQSSSGLSDQHPTLTGTRSPPHPHTSLSEQAGTRPVDPQFPPVPGQAPSIPACLPPTG